MERQWKASKERRERKEESRWEFDPIGKFFVRWWSTYCNSVICRRGLGLVLEAPRPQRAVALALTLITKFLALVLALR